jgi:hypothetical protein
MTCKHKKVEWGWLMWWARYRCGKCGAWGRQYYGKGRIEWDEKDAETRERTLRLIREARA